MIELKENMKSIIITLVYTMIVSLLCNYVGYETGIIESIPGLVTLVVISIIGYLLSYIIPIKKISAVLWISIIAILAASPISPINGFVIDSVQKISLMSVVTPILAYAGVLVGNDWKAFKEVGPKGIIVSVFVITGTFLISSLLGDLFMNIF